VIRSPWAGSAEIVARNSSASVVNAGDGKHEHPSQALLDLYTLLRHVKTLEGREIWIVGDVMHSRVARSNVLAFTRLGARVTVAGPPTLIPRDFETLGCEIAYDLERLGEADVIYALRMQHERMGADGDQNHYFVPSLREYVSCFQIDSRRLQPRQLLMHPGPVNRGVELSAEVIDSPQTLIADQVASGVVVRMAVLYDLLSAAPDETPRSGSSAPTVEQPA
jgi:aspartate carbamoyltransferase catalytic subunit